MTRPPHHARRLRRVAAALAAATALLLTGCSAFSMSDPEPSSSPTVAPVARQPVAVAIGDSIAIGVGVPAPDAWPFVTASRLGWNLTDFGEGGAGFTTQGVNTHVFDDQVSAAIRLRPQVVIVAATRNDAYALSTGTPTAALTRSTTAAIRRLAAALPDTTIIGMGSVWGATAKPATAAVVDNALRSAVLSVGGHWLTIGQLFLGHPALMQKDGVHPTTDGQALLGKAVADAIAEAGIEPGTARRSE
jgi:acyl-CoA thioesterase-1